MHTYKHLDKQLLLIREHLKDTPKIEVTYFKPDEKKNGGAYLTFCGHAKYIDEYNRRILFTDKTALLIEHIYSISGELFYNMD